MYSIIRPILFKIDPEKVHHLVTKGLKFFNSFPGGQRLSRALWDFEDNGLAKKVFGLTFKNPVGLAAGFDKNGELIAEMANLGFGFIEVGTVTPLPQPGNPQPRMFRLPADEGLINRMGFNNLGVEVLAENIEKFRKSADSIQIDVIIGGNIGKNKITPNEDAVNDYIICFDRLFDLVDYFVVNVSSPNTPGLRELQEKGPLTNILQTLQDRNLKHSVTKPILLKIAPDLSNEQLDDIVDIVQTTGIAGVIATNTTIKREGLVTDTHVKTETGGLSGKPLTNRATEVIAYLTKKSKGRFPIIGVGGVHSPQDAIDKLNAGASLVQLYTGFIYEGPGLIKRINKKILETRPLSHGK